MFFITKSKTNSNSKTNFNHQYSTINMMKVRDIELERR